MAKEKKIKIPKKILKLKSGNHQFVPGAHSFHNNENTSSDELQWYMNRYPHIQNLFEPDNPDTSEPEIKSTEDQQEQTQE